MHEQSIVESLLALAIENAEKAKASKILRIYLVVGELSGVVEESVDFYFSIPGKDTIASESSHKTLHFSGGDDEHHLSLVAERPLVLAGVGDDDPVAALEHRRDNGVSTGRREEPAVYVRYFINVHLRGFELTIPTTS